MTRLLTDEERALEAERLFDIVIDCLAVDCEPEARHDLKVRLAASEPMGDCPPGVDEQAWRKLRSWVGDPNMRRRLWAALTDIEIRRSPADEQRTDSAARLRGGPRRVGADSP